MEQQKLEEKFIELENLDPEEDIDNKEEENEMKSEEFNDTEEESVVRQSQRERERPDYYGVWINSTEVLDKEPTTVSDALSSPEKQE